MRIIKWLGIFSILFILTACSTLTGVGKDNTPPPSPLVNFSPTVYPRFLWSTHIASASKKQYVNFVPAFANGQLFIADSKGHVFAINATTGATVWQINVKTSLMVGTAVANGLVFVGSNNGDLFALKQTNGNIVWHVILPDMITAVPLIVNDKVIAKTLDGEIWALNFADGKTVWQYNHGAPALVLAGGSQPQTNRNQLIVGYADGKLAAYSLNQGNLLWETQIASPMGASDIEQMVDIVAAPVFAGNIIYVVTYQGNLAAVNANSGQMLWQQPMSSYTGLAISRQTVFVTDATGNIAAFNQANGQLRWKITAFRYRNLTAPAIMDGQLVIADGEGYVHWLDTTTGATVGRLFIAKKSPIVAAPLVNNHVVYVLTTTGKLVAVSAN